MKLYWRFFIVFGLLGTLSEEMLAAHIIGGEMYYECQGYASNGLDSTRRTYKIIIKLYRDCRPQQNSAGFDQPLGFTIYRKNANGSGYTNALGNNREYSIPRLTLGPNFIEPPEYPCLILPPDICVESGTYEYFVDLPIINEEYVIVWQRCCRNNTITNIQAPEATGATFTISIHPEAQRTCNNSPVFNNFPPTVVCVNNPLKFDHSAYDKEGDLLVYSFCDPLSGGGRGGGGGNCNSVTPTPDCPPPFTPVAFRAPQYTYLFPMGGNPPVTINSLTGQISGEPNTIGQFVVSVCVSEYRNGVLLSTLRRDFQFNVASCQGTVVARLNNGVEVRKKNYEILLCNSTQLQMSNGSYQQQFITNTVWEYENGGITETFNGWHPLIDFKEGGLHNGRFILNPGTNCSDTVQFQVNVIPPIQPDFSVSFDSCKAGPVEFKDLSTSAYSTINNWNWDFGDGFKGFTKDYTLQYIHPDRYTIYLEIADNFGCKNKTQKGIVWQPAPDVVIFEPSIREGCVPLEVQFKNISFPTDNSYSFNWIFSDSTKANGFSVKKVFDSIGSYNLKLQVTSPLGCFNEAEFNNVVNVFPPPMADGNIDKTLLNIKNPVLRMEDKTQNTVGRSWIIDGSKYYFDKDLSYTFADTGMHHIRLIVNDRFLCTDTMDFELFIFRDFSLFMPNAFTPNGDGLNEEFLPIGEIHSLDYFSLKIFDRWGGLLFESNDPNKGWNGKYNNSGKDIPPGAYVYELKYRQSRKEARIEKKMVTLIR
jgi:gliding motility-associated-like protein